MLDWSFLSPYYQNQFAAIRKSDGLSIGAFNWAAFLLGIFWLLAKGCWLAAVVWGLVLAAVWSGGDFFKNIGFIVQIAVMIIIGVRGNYICYRAMVKNQQTAW